jgi:hypothetical protein
MAVGAYYSWINLSSWYAQGGSALTITGHNYAPGETVNAKSGSQDLGSGVASGLGDVVITTHVPYAPSGPATIVATGATSGAPGQATMTVAPVYTDLQLASYAGAPGTAVDFVGHGYVGNDHITVATDRSSGTVASFDADATGNFNNSSFVIPSGYAEGNLTLTVTGQNSYDTKSIVFYVLPGAAPAAKSFAAPAPQEEVSAPSDDTSTSTPPVDETTPPTEASTTDATTTPQQ